MEITGVPEWMPSLRPGHRPTSRRTQIEWILKGLAFCCVALCVYSLRRADPDLWGYLAYGRLFVEQRGPVTLDPFAYTSAGFHWVTFEYLAQVLIWEAYHLAGPSGLIVLKCIVGGAATYFLVTGIRATSDDASVWVPVFVLAASTISRWFWFRPQLFTFAFFALYTAILVGFLLGRSRTLWVLPVIMLAWANLHGGFLAGLGVLCVALALRILQNANALRRGWGLLSDTRALSAALLASLVVTLVNPQGARIWSYVLTEVVHSTNRLYIAEWRPTLQSGDQWTAGTLVFLTTGLAIVGWLSHRHASLVGGVRPWQWVLSCVPLTMMAFQSVRHVPIATIWIAPVLALLASDLKSRLSGPHLFQLVWPLVVGIACIPAMLMCYTVVMRPWPEIDTSASTFGSTHPCSAVSFLRQNHLSGNLYTSSLVGLVHHVAALPGSTGIDGRPEHLALSRSHGCREPKVLYRQREPRRPRRAVSS